MVSFPSAFYLDISFNAWLSSADFVHRVWAFPLSCWILLTFCSCCSSSTTPGLTAGIHGKATFRSEEKMSYSNIVLQNSTTLSSNLHCLSKHRTKWTVWECHQTVTRLRDNGLRHVGFGSGWGVLLYMRQRWSNCGESEGVVVGDIRPSSPSPEKRNRNAPPRVPQSPRPLWDSHPNCKEDIL